MVSVTIQSSAFLAACATGMSYPEIKDASEVISAPAFIWEVSPNPVTSQIFTVKMSKPLADIEPEITLYNLNGQLVKAYKVTSIESRFETSGLTEGIYILKISNGIETDEKRIYIGQKQ